MKGDFTRFTFDSMKKYTQVLQQQGRVDLDADWNEQGEIHAYLEQTEAKDVIGSCGVPKSGGGFKIGTAADGSDLTISPGRIYVDGILCELDAEARYLSQDDYPDPPALNPPSNGMRKDLVYLDVWQRHITAIEDPDIREKALGGPDTTTRVQTVWQVKVQEKVGDVACEALDFKKLFPSPTGRLSTQVKPAPTTKDPCLIAPGTGYRGLENRLYRVEIHEGGAPGQATFKWSRDNGSVVFAVEEFVANYPNKLKVTSLGRDQVLALRKGDWVEVLDDETELMGKPGTLAKIDDIVERTLTLNKSVSGYGQQGHPKVRRWDQKSSEIKVSTSDYDLEDGIQIKFSGSNFRTGDFWVFDARTATGEVEPLTNAPPRGIEHHYCPLALIAWERKIYAERRLIFATESGYEPDLAESWTISNHGHVYDFTLVDGVIMPNGLKFNADVALQILLSHEVGLTGQPHDELTIQFKFEGPVEGFLQQVSNVIIIPGSEELLGHVEDCRSRFPPLTDITAEDVSFDDSVCNMSAENVQEALEVLCQRSPGTAGGCLCTVTLGVDGVDSLQMAVDKLKDKGGCICIPAGDWTQTSSVVLNNTENISIMGCGAASRVKYGGGGELFFLSNAKEILFRDFAMECTGNNAVVFKITGDGNENLTIEGCVVNAPNGIVLEKNNAGVSGLFVRHNQFKPPSTSQTMRALLAEGVIKKLTNVQIVDNTFRGGSDLLLFEVFPTGGEVVVARNQIETVNNGVFLKRIQTQARLVLDENRMTTGGAAVKVNGGGGEVHVNANIFKSPEANPMIVIGNPHGEADKWLEHILFSNNQLYTGMAPGQVNCTVELGAKRLVVMGNYVADLLSGEPSGTSICLPGAPQSATAIGNITSNGVRGEGTVGVHIIIVNNAVL